MCESKNLMLILAVQLRSPGTWKDVDIQVAKEKDEAGCRKPQEHEHEKTRFWKGHVYHAWAPKPSAHDLLGT